MRDLGIELPGDEPACGPSDVVKAGERAEQNRKKEPAVPGLLDALPTSAPMPSPSINDGRWMPSKTPYNLSVTIEASNTYSGALEKVRNQFEELVQKPIVSALGNVFESPSEKIAQVGVDMGVGLSYPETGYNRARSYDAKALSYASDNLNQSTRKPISVDDIDWNMVQANMQSIRPVVSWSDGVTVLGIPCVITKRVSELGRQTIVYTTQDGRAQFRFVDDILQEVGIGMPAGSYRTVLKTFDKLPTVEDRERLAEQLPDRYEEAINQLFTARKVYDKDRFNGQ